MGGKHRKSIELPLRYIKTRITKERNRAYKMTIEGMFESIVNSDPGNITEPTIILRDKLWITCCTQARKRQDGTEYDFRFAGSPQPTPTEAVQSLINRIKAERNANEKPQAPKTPDSTNPTEEA